MQITVALQKDHCQCKSLTSILHADGQGQTTLADENIMNQRQEDKEK